MFFFKLKSKGHLELERLKALSEEGQTINQSEKLKENMALERAQLLREIAELKAFKEKAEKEEEERLKKARSEAGELVVLFDSQRVKQENDIKVDFDLFNQMIFD